MTLLWHLRLVGALLMVLGAAHAGFPRYFGWREEFGRVSLFSRQLFYVHTAFVALTVFGMGMLTCCEAPELLKPSPLARWVAGAFTVFWACRWACQFWVYSPQLWRGHRFNTCMHIAFALLWTYLVGVYGAVWWRQMQG